MNRIARTMSRTRSGEGGFTLIEMMIVAAVIAILTLIAYPSYVNSVREGKRGQAKGDLVNVANSMERCFTQTNTYVGCALAQTTSGTNGQTNYNISFQAGPTASTYTIQAVPTGDQTNDKCGTLTVNQAGVRGPATTSGGQACF